MMIRIHPTSIVRGAGEGGMGMQAPLYCISIKNCKQDKSSQEAADIAREAAYKVANHTTAPHSK